METIKINKVDTFKIIYNNKRIHANKNRYNFTTKFPWKCLGCLEDIFVSYNQYGTNSICCENCKALVVSNPNIVQYQYVRVLKDRQIKLVESFNNNQK